MSEKIRLQKYLSEQGVCSRRMAEELMRAGKVRVNGKSPQLGCRVNAEDKIVVEGKTLKSQKMKTILLAFHKPKGIETTLAAGEEKTLNDFVWPGRVFPVGRLDRDSTGLLLMTNDGELGNQLAHPKYGHEKEYLVKVGGEVTPSALKMLQAGIKWEKKTLGAKKVEVVQDGVLRFILTQGANRQIRRMCEAVGLKVLELLRIRMGCVHLGELPPGKWRVLSAVEEKGLRKRN